MCENLKYESGRFGPIGVALRGTALMAVIAAGVLIFVVLIVQYPLPPVPRQLCLASAAIVGECGVCECGMEAVRMSLEAAELLGAPKNCLLCVSPEDKPALIEKISRIERTEVPELRLKESRAQTLKVIKQGVLGFILLTAFFWLALFILQLLILIMSGKLFSKT